MLAGTDTSNHKAENRTDADSSGKQNCDNDKLEAKLKQATLSSFKVGWLVEQAENELASANNQCANDAKK